MRIRLGAIVLLFILAAGTGHAQPKLLSLNHAIQAALENNAEVGIAEEQTVQAHARAKEQRSELLPDFNGLIGHTNQTINLGSRGLDFPGLPTRAGPFGNTDVRVQFSEPLDLSLIRRYRSARRASSSSEFDTKALRSRVAGLVARLYFDVLRGGAMVGAVRAQIELDESLLKLARDRQEAGAGTSLDVTRAQSRLAADRHRLAQAQNELRTSQLQLLRAMGDRLDSQIELTGSLAATIASPPDADEAVEIAFRNRSELKAEQERLAAARLTYGAARAETFPTFQAFADYGNSGNADAFVPTRTAGFQVNISFFDGGRRAAHRTTARSQLRQVEIRAKDLRDQVELDVRVALDNLSSAKQQLEAAIQSLQLAQEELDLSRLRFEAQVSTQIDVVSAQAELAAARSRHVNALFAVRAAEVEYQQAAGLEIR